MGQGSGACFRGSIFEGGKGTARKANKVLSRHSQSVLPRVGRVYKEAPSSCLCSLKHITSTDNITSPLHHIISRTSFYFLLSHQYQPFSMPNRGSSKRPNERYDFEVDDGFQDHDYRQEPNYQVYSPSLDASHTPGWQIPFDAETLTYTVGFPPTAAPGLAYTSHTEDPRMDQIHPQSSQHAKEQHQHLHLAPSTHHYRNEAVEEEQVWYGQDGSSRSAQNQKYDVDYGDEAYDVNAPHRSQNDAESDWGSMSARAGRRVFFCTFTL